jgi:hypothetical protein
MNMKKIYTILLLLIAGCRPPDKPYLIKFGDARIKKLSCKSMSGKVECTIQAGYLILGDPSLLDIGSSVYIKIRNKDTCEFMISKNSIVFESKNYLYPTISEFIDLDEGGQNNKEIVKIKPDEEKEILIGIYGKSKIKGESKKTNEIKSDEELLMTFTTNQGVLEKTLPNPIIFLPELIK